MSIHLLRRTVPPRLIERDVSQSLLGRPRRASIYPNFQFGVRSGHASSLKLIRTFQAPQHNCRWTITDANLSPDNNWMAYSSITPIVHLVKTRGENAVLGLGLEDHEQEVLDFSGHPYMGSNFGIWSLRFSGDGKELIAGGSHGTSHKSIGDHCHDAGMIYQMSKIFVDVHFIRSNPRLRCRKEGIRA